MADNLDKNATGTQPVATDDISGVHHQRVKVEFGADGTATDVSDANPLPTKVASTTATLTSVAASATSVTLIAANANRRGLIFHAVGGSANLYLRLGAVAATAALGGHSVDIVSGAIYECPFGYTGEVRGIWAAASGGVNITELT